MKYKKVGKNKYRKESVFKEFESEIWTVATVIAAVSFIIVTASLIGGILSVTP